MLADPLLSLAIGRSGCIDQPLFVLTSDQDWAPEWACEQFLMRVKVHNIPLHVFRTSPSPALDAAAAAGEITQGWHPNFLPGSSHGEHITQVVDYCQTNFPGVRTVRSHCYAEDSFRWQALADAGIVADSQIVTLFQSYIAPLVHWTGILRFPVFFEDDTFFEWLPNDLPIERIEPTLFSPGLKILNFHATFVACNTPSRSHYDATRGNIFHTPSPRPGVVFQSRGTVNVMEEIFDRVQHAGYTFVSFEDVVSRFLQFARESEDFAPLIRLRMEGNIDQNQALLPSSSSTTFD
jgi:hypothetical protein